VIAVNNFYNVINNFNFLTMKNGPLPKKDSSSYTISEAMNIILKHYKMKEVALPAGMADEKESMEYILKVSGLIKRDVLLDGKWWKSYSAPLLVKTKENGYRVLLKTLSESYSYYDLKDGRMKKVTKHNFELFGEKAIYFYKPLPPGGLTIRDLLNYLVGTVSPMYIITITLGAVLAALFGIAFPIVNKYIYDIIIPSGNYNDMFSVFILLAGIALSSFLLSIVRRLSAEGLISKTKLAFEGATFHRLLNLPYSFFNAYPSGELTNYLLSVGLLIDVLINVILTLFYTIIFSVAYLIQIKILAPNLFLPAFIVFFVLLFLVLIFVGNEHRLQKKNFKLSAELFGFVNQMIKGIEKIKLCGSEIYAFTNWGKRYNEKVKIYYHKRILFLVEEAMFTIIISLGVLMFYIGASPGNISPSSFIAFNIAYMAMVTVMIKLAQCAQGIALILPIINSTMPIYRQETESFRGGGRIIEPKGSIQVQNLSFSYEDDDEPVINNISFEIKKGEYIGIVGEAGCGKSTLLKLLLGLEKAKKGAVYYDEIDINDVDLISLRQKIGTVMQNQKLVHDSIFYNIAAGNKNISMEEARQAAETAGIAQDINEMPMGFLTVISEAGGGISEGQAQRIMIARAIVNKPNILFFDEATSALDNTTQGIVISQLEKFKCTRIAIAHRLTTVRKCDRIIVIGRGEIVQQGNYDALINEEGLFKLLAKRQAL
jgi:ABC-type bacteriocin/lantibiotic exporter with double-glycine peptidase domain